VQGCPSSSSLFLHTVIPRVPKPHALLAAYFISVSCLAYCLTPKIKATCSFETSVVFQRTPRRYIPEDNSSLLPLWEPQIVHRSFFLCCSHSLLAVCSEICEQPWAWASHRGCPGSSPSQAMWVLWWTKWHLGRFSPSTSVSLANCHLTDSSMFIIIYHLGLVQ
jgi:hypothetical protein